MEDRKPGKKRNRPSAILDLLEGGGVQIRRGTAAAPHPSVEEVKKIKK